MNQYGVSGGTWTCLCGYSCRRTDLNEIRRAIMRHARTCAQAPTLEAKRRGTRPGVRPAKVVVPQRVRVDVRTRLSAVVDAIAGVDSPWHSA